MTYLLYGLPNTRNPPDSEAHTGLDKRLTRELKTYRIEDPPVKQGKPISFGIMHSIMASRSYTYDPKAHHIANWVQLGLYL